MNDYLSLTSFTFDGGSIASVTVMVQTSVGMVAMQRPFVSIGPGLAVAPVVTADGPALRIALDSWLAMYQNGTQVVVLPMALTTQSAAVQAAHDFTRDPAITWNATPEALLAWCHAWAAAPRTTPET